MRWPVTNTRKRAAHAASARRKLWAGAQAQLSAHIFPFRTSYPCWARLAVSLGKAHRYPLITVAILVWQPLLAGLAAWTVDLFRLPVHDKAGQVKALPSPLLPGGIGWYWTTNGHFMLGLTGNEDFGVHIAGVH